MTAQKKKTRLFVTAALTPGGRLELDGARAHYLGHVMRLRAGSGVMLFNGRDGEWSATIEDLGKNRCLVSVDRRLRRQESDAGPWLAFAPVKKTGTGFIVEKATELGVSRLCPVFTRHTNSTRINLDRLLARAIEASEQCERLTVPDFDAPDTLDRLCGRWPSDRRLLVLDESGAGRPIAEVLAELGNSGGGTPRACGFLSGPEGGFDASELDALRELDFVTAVRLGPRILRAETAALAALACWQAILDPGR